MINEKQRLQAIAVAYLLSKNVKQVDIAESLGLHPPQVARMKALAERIGIMHEKVTFNSEKVNPEEWDKVQARFFGTKELPAGLTNGGIDLKINLNVFSSTNPQAFLQFAAARVRELIQNSKCIGVSWGRTVERVIGLLAQDAGDERKHFVPCIPLCGDPVHLMHNGKLKFSASNLANSLNEAINVQSSTRLPCLVGVPAYLKTPRIRSKQGHFFENYPGYREIFGSPKSNTPTLMDRVDTVITGLGIIKPENDLEGYETADFIQERMLQENLTDARLRELIFGDFNGILYKRPNLGKDDSILVDRMNKGWVGMKPAHLDRITDGVRRDSAPGVILIATGKGKARMVKEVVLRGHANEVIIDTLLYDELQEESLINAPRATGRNFPLTSAVPRQTPRT